MSASEFKSSRFLEVVCFLLAVGGEFVFPDLRFPGVLRGECEKRGCTVKGNDEEMLVVARSKLDKFRFRWYWDCPCNVDKMTLRR